MGEIIPAPAVRPEDEIGFARVRDGQPKDVKAAQVMTVTLACRREHKFSVGDTRRECHLGLKGLDLEKCANCIWFDCTTGQRSRLLTGGQALALTGMLRSLKETEKKDFIVREGSDHA